MDRSSRTATMHGRILSIGHLAVIGACVGRFLAVTALLIVTIYAGVASWPALEITIDDLARWLEELERHGKLPPSVERYIAERQPAVRAAFLRARDGYAFPLTLFLLGAGTLIGVSFILIRNYLHEGLAARQLASGDASPKLDALLQRARDALPPGFPPAQLRLARATFIRHRGRDLIAFLQDRLLVLLGKGHRREFQFVVAHELYHLRCFDSLASTLSRSSVRILAIIGAVGCFFAPMDLTAWLFRGIPGGMLLQAVVGVSLSYVAVRRWWKADLPFFRHKELLADRFAWELDPSVDLARTWDPGRPRPDHPSAGERLAFLRDGRTATAYVAFLTAQELLLCFLYLFWTRGYDRTMGVWPRLLDIPCFALALAGSVIFAAEAWRYPIPDRQRKPLAIRTGVLFALGLLLAYDSDEAVWFFVTQLVLMAVVALRVATFSPTSATDDGPSEDIVVEAQPARRQALSDRVGRGLSWLALIWGTSTLFQMLFGHIGMYGFGRGLPAGVTMHLNLSAIITSYLHAAAAVIVGLRNLKRPHVVTLVGEWAFYAVAMFLFVDSSFWLWDRLGVQSWSQTKIDVMRLPWGSREAMEAAGRAASDYPRAFRVTLLPQILIAVFYIRCIRRLG